MIVVLVVIVIVQPQYVFDFVIASTDDVGKYKKTDTCDQELPMANAGACQSDIVFVFIPAFPFGPAVSIASKLSFSQLASIPHVGAAPGVVLFVAKTLGVVVPIVDFHERVMAAKFHHKFSQGDLPAFAPHVPPPCAG